MTPDSVRVLAPAKVNLFLGVGPKRPDGYHDVVTVTCAVDLVDEVTLAPAPALTLSCDRDLGVAPESNLAWRAAVSLAEKFSRDPGVSIELRKHIPHGAGLGGGSSDAAAVIAGLATMWGEELEDPRCLDVAASLGADVPLFLLGGCALLDGRGDHLVRTLEPPVVPVVLVRPDQPVATAAAYAAFDADPQPAGTPDAVVAALEGADVVALGAALANNMEAASSSLVPAVGEALAWVKSREGVLGGAMAGSGSAVFALCASPEAAQAIAEDARSRGWWSHATQTRRGGVGGQEGSW